MFDHCNIRPLTHYIDELKCCLSLPVVLGRDGVVRTINVPFNAAERKGLEDSAKHLRGVIAAVEEGGI